VATSESSLLLSLAESIADGAAVDWAAMEARAGSGDRGVVRQMRVLAELSTLHRSLPQLPVRLTEAPRPRSSSAPAIGRWGHLDLIARIGGGASGDVYRAWDRHLEREVALKLLRIPEESDDPFTSRIVTEGRLLASVRHPNVVAVHGVMEHDGRVGLWMELVEGSTLEEVIAASGPFGAGEAALVGVDLCRALAAIHRAGLVHRDVKTQNVIRERGGRIVLMDLGAGRRLDATSGSGSDLTGTPLSLAPELFEGGSASARTDVYSLGVLMYRIVTGEFPVRAATMEELATAHRQGRVVRLRDARPDLPGAFVQVVDRAIARDPAQRYASAGDLEADLRFALNESAASPAVTGYAGTASRRTISPKWAALAAGALLVAVLVGMKMWKPANTPGLVATRISTIAVLPFQNLSTDSAEEYLAATVPMELTSRLGEIGSLHVVPWTFMKRYDVSRRNSLREIAENTGAQAVIEGSVQRPPAGGGEAGKRVKVQVQVFEAGVGSLLWSGSFERDLSDFFILQTEIAQEVVQRIHLVLAAREQAQVTKTRVVPPLAMEEYLHARYLDAKADGPGALDSLERAVRLAPDFAEAWAALAYAYVLESAFYESVPSVDALGRAVNASDRAIAIDDSLAEGWMARGFARFALEWNWREADADFQRALARNPNSVDALTMYSDYLSHRGRHAEAISTARKAAERARLSTDASRQLAYAYYMAHQFEDAIQELRRTISIDAGFGPAHTLLGRCLLLTGKVAEGLAEIERAGPDYRDMLAIGHAWAGNRDEADRLLRTLREAGHPPSSYTAAAVAAALHEPAGALKLLETAYANKEPALTALAVDPLFDSIRREPRFVALLARIGLPRG
jgi:TolB-like protein/tRNA A-37 threonylcarbamoyl transferase component Bud32/Flp pilus assembly protein TadD